MLKQDKEKRGFLYNFLLNPKFSIWRHSLLVLIITIIAINSTFGTYGKSFSILGNNIYWILLFYIILDLGVVYFNLYLLVPKLLLKSKYLQYIIALFILVSVFILIDSGCEDYISKGNNTSSIFNRVKAFSVDFVVYTILIVGLSITVLFKGWLVNSQRIKQLETDGLRSQLENMKEKVSPSFLSRILKRAASLATSTPSVASAVLLKLSKILRYQLYDCNREKVLLVSEIEFLTNYLNLEKEYYESFDFRISKDGDMNHIFIPPLLFLPFIQKSIIQMKKENNLLMLDIQFIVKENQLKFICIDNGVYNEVDYSAIRHRLELLYGNKYSIDVKPKKELIIQVSI